MTVQALRTVRLYGPLGKAFGREHRLAIRTPHEAVQALSHTIAGFADFLLTKHHLGYKVIAGDPRTIETIHAPVGGSDVVKIVPVVGGAKKGGLGLILAGVALFFGAPIIGGLISSTAVGGVVALYGMKIGVALMLGGVISLLSPQRKGGGNARPENLPSYSYDGPINTTQQGLPVPVGYGRCIVGSAVISAGLTVDDISPAPPAPPPAPPPLPADQQFDYQTWDRG